MKLIWKRVLTDRKERLYELVSWTDVFSPDELPEEYYNGDQKIYEIRTPTTKRLEIVDGSSKNGSMISYKLKIGSIVTLEERNKIKISVQRCINQLITLKNAGKWELYEVVKDDHDWEGFLEEDDIV